MALLDNDIDGLKAIDEERILDFVLYDHELWSNEEEHMQALINKINTYLEFIQGKIYLNNTYQDIYKSFVIKIVYKQQSQEFKKLMSCIKPELMNRNIIIELVDIANLNS